jgi:hypothetical protein
MTWEELKTLADGYSEKEGTNRAEDTCASKRPYQTQAAAIASLIRFKRAGKKKRGRHVYIWQRQKVYKCDVCGQYHLTKM